MAMPGRQPRLSALPQYFASIYQKLWLKSCHYNVSWLPASVGSPQRTSFRHFDGLPGGLLDVCPPLRIDCVWGSCRLGAAACWILAKHTHPWSQKLKCLCEAQVPKMCMKTAYSSMKIFWQDVSMAKEDGVESRWFLVAKNWQGPKGRWGCSYAHRLALI